MIIANIPDVHPLADWRTNSRTVKTDGDASEIPKRGIISPSGGLDGWKNTRKKSLRLAGSRECSYRGVRWSGHSLRASSEYGVTLK